MWSPKYERSISPTIRDTGKHHAYTTEQPRETRVRDFEEHRRRQFAERRQLEEQRQFAEQRQLEEQRLAERRQFAEQNPIIYQRQVKERFNSVENDVLRYRIENWPSDMAREHVLGKLELWEKLEYQGYAALLQQQRQSDAALLQQQRQERIKQIRPIVRRMNQLIPSTQNESGLSQLIDKSTVARDECFDELREFGRNKKTSAYFETDVAIVEKLRVMHDRGDPNVRRLYTEWNLIEGLRRKLPELKDNYIDEDMAMIYDKIESLTSNKNNSSRWRILQRRWKDLTAEPQPQQNTQHP